MGVAGSPRRGGDHLDRGGKGADRTGRSWASPSDVEPASHTATQLRLMRDLVDGKVDAPSFAKEWFAARTRALDSGEKVREQFDCILLDLFYVLEDYVIDPELRRNGDLTDEQLVEQVAALLTRLDQLDSAAGASGAP